MLLERIRREFRASDPLHFDNRARLRLGQTAVSNPTCRALTERFGVSQAELVLDILALGFDGLDAEI